MKKLAVLILLVAFLSSCAGQIPVKQSQIEPDTRPRININDLEIREDFNNGSINIQEPETTDISFQEWADQVEGKPVDPSVGYTSAPYTEKNKRSRYFMFLGQGFDLGTTVYALSTGDFEEGNPIGFVGVVVAKVVVGGLTYYWVEVKHAGHPKQQKMRDKYYRLVGWAGVIPGTWNTIQILRAN